MSITVYKFSLKINVYGENKILWNSFRYDLSFFTWFCIVSLVSNTILFSLIEIWQQQQIFPLGLGLGLSMLYDTPQTREFIVIYSFNSNQSMNGLDMQSSLYGPHAPANILYQKAAVPSYKNHIIIMFSITNISE